MSRAQPISAQEYLSVDDHLETGESLTDDDIVSLVVGTDQATEDSDESDEEEVPMRPLPPTISQARAALSQLQLFFEAKYHEEGCLLMYDVEKVHELAPKETVQTTIHSYFK